jgi:hypothetical protein
MTKNTEMAPEQTALLEIANHCCLSLIVKFFSPLIESHQIKQNQMN